MLPPSKRIFLTGIAGFIGYHLALFLKKRNDFVIGCDNFNAYYDVALKRARAHNLTQLGIEVLEEDIRTPSALASFLEKYGITHVVHLAAQAGVRYSLTNPLDYIHTNVEGFIHVLESCRKFPYIKLVYASSSSVYGLNTKTPFQEEDPTDTPSSVYAATKKSGELLAHAYHHLYGLSITGLRYFTVYGPWGRPDMAYFLFTKAILEKKPLSIYGDGQLKRDFTYIDDIISGTAAALDRGSSYEIFNLGNHSSHSVIELIESIEKACSQTTHKEFHPSQPGDVPFTHADVSKSQSLLGFTPQTSLQKGIEHFVHWYREYYKK